VSHLLPLLVTVPIVGALVPVVLGARRPVLSRRLTAGVLVGQVGLAVAVLVGVAATGPRTYVVGGLPAAVGIGLRADAVSSVFVLLVAVAAAALSLTVRTETTGPTDSLWLLFVAGLTGIAVTADVFNLYVFLEISGLAAYALVAGRRGTRAALAAFHYLVVGTIGATLYLLGVGYLYVATGTLAMADLRVALAGIGYDSPLVVTAFVLVTVGLGVKLALFPLQAWKPDAYAAATPDVSALLATLGSTIPGYALVRLVFDVFTASFLDAVPLVRGGLLVVGVASVAAGGFLALRQSDVRRLLAYSSVLQMGLVVLGIAIATPAAVTAALVLLVANAVAKGGLYAATGVLADTFGATTVDSYAGLGRDAPLTAAAVGVALVSLVGLPPTVGFAGKWYLAVAVVDARAWVVVVVVLLSTLLSLAYAGRVVERLYLAPAGHEVEPVATDGGGLAPVPTRDRAVAFVVVAALATVLVGLGSTALAAWFAPVVEGWL
jgi:multicomponent Na+:H+ antiporter subunit D